MSQDNHKSLPVEEIRAYCETQPIQRLYLLPADYDIMLRPDMDIGMLVEYEPGVRTTYIDLGRNERELGGFVDLRVDLHMPAELASDDPKSLIDRSRLLYENGS